MTRDIQAVVLSVACLTVVFTLTPLSCSAKVTFAAAGSIAQDASLSDKTIPECNASNFRIIVDVGHTLQAPGATSARGVSEFFFNSLLAKEIVDNLRQAGYGHTSEMTVTGAGRRQLENRSTRANEAKADLFLSIHHDDVQPTYYKTWLYNGVRRHFSDIFSGYSLFVSYDNKFSEASVAFAKLLANELVVRGMHFSAHHSENIHGENREIIDPERGIYRYDHLSVLRNTVAPAVLLEAGVIVNRDEELLLASKEQRRDISAAVLVAINRFCEATQSKNAR